MYAILIITLYIVAIQSTESNGQSCFDMVNVQQQGNVQFNRQVQVIVPRSSFSCNGRLTGYLISLDQNNDGDEYPSIEIWRPSVSGLSYSRISEYVLTEDDISDREDYYFANISFAVDETTQFQPGDIIGYFQPSSSHYAISNVNSAEHTSLSSLNLFRIEVFVLANPLNRENNIQPLIQVLYDIQCNDLSIPANGMMSCSSGTVGVGYEGDTCSFTCNTGYELTGSDTRICQSDGNWNGTEAMCRDEIIITSAILMTTTAIPTIITRTNDTANVTDSASNLMATTPPSGVMATTDLLVTIAPAEVMATTPPTNLIATTSPSDVRATTPHTDSIATTPPTDVMALIPPTVQEQNGDSGSGVGGIVAGCVIALAFIITIVVCLIIFLIWYRGKQKREHAAKTVGSHEQHGKSRYIAEYHEVTKQGTVKNIVYNNPEYYSSADQLYCVNGRNNEAMPYLIPVKTIGKIVSSDYEVVPKLEGYEQTGLYKDVQYEAVDYSLSTGNILPTNTMSSNTLPVGEALSKDEQIYEDPGHIKEEIYKWFKQRNICRLDKNIISVSDFIGSGEFGTVHLGLWSNGSTDPVKVAVKTLNSQCLESDRIKFLREAAIMGQFVHNNVVQLHGVVTEEESMMIVLEYMPKGDLRNHLLKAKTQSIKSSETDSELKYNLLSYCRQVAAGMNYLASKQFVHRDLAARNILVSNDDVCKIADFGLARDIADDSYYITTGGKIPMKWTSPEAILYKKYSVQSDVWSFGCVMYEVWSLGYKPFKDYSGPEYVRKITTGYRLPPPSGCPRAIYELMIRCWHPEARCRPHPELVLRALQNQDKDLLQWSMPDNDKIDGQAAMLGAPLTASEHLYPDLQSLYIKTAN